MAGGHVGDDEPLFEQTEGLVCHLSCEIQKTAKSPTNCALWWGGEAHSRYSQASSVEDKGLPDPEGKVHFEEHCY